MAGLIRQRFMEKYNPLKRHQTSVFQILIPSFSLDNGIKTIDKQKRDKVIRTLIAGSLFDLGYDWKAIKKQVRKLMKMS